MLLDGRTIAEKIKQRHVRAVSDLGFAPQLAIIQAGDDPVSNRYINVKQKYGQAIGAEVSLHKIQADEVEATIQKLNQDQSVNGIIIQLPLPSEVDVDETFNQIDPSKDVDGMGSRSKFEPATPMAILQLLDGHSISLKNKRVAIVGQGRLVGKPLKKMLDKSSIKSDVFDDTSTDLATKLQNYDVIITATGQPSLIKSDMVKSGTVVIDAGTSEAGGKVVGDANPALYDRDDIQISPIPGGVGPLTVCALFENLINATKTTI